MISTRVSQGKTKDGVDARKGQYTSIIKKLIRVQAGRVTTPLEFSMRDLRMMSIRSNILVQLETIDENKLLQDNLIFMRLNEVEQMYKQYHCIDLKAEQCFSEEKKAEVRAQMEADKEHFYHVVGRYLKGLQERRERLGHQMESRDHQVKAMELEGVSEDEIGDFYGDRSIFDLSHETMKGLLAKARANMHYLASNMDSRLGWSEWDSDLLQKGIFKTPMAREYIDTIQAQKYKDMKLETDFQKEHPAEYKNYVRELEKRSYESYLLNMNAFLGGHIPGLTISQNTFDQFEENNYREHPAVPFVDLNLYRNSDVSGLAPRAFIGPCTLVANDNMSELRPTDTIDEDNCTGLACHDGSQDADETRETVDNSEFEQSPYHDSLILFKDKLVDDFFDDFKKNEVDYVRKMNVLSQIGNFVQTYNMDYVSLDDVEPLMVYKKGCEFDEVASDMDCFHETQKGRIQSQDFISLLQEEDFPSLLRRYFHMRPLKRHQEINDQMEVSTRPSNDLERIWPRTKRILREMLVYDGRAPGAPLYHTTRNNGSIDQLNSGKLMEEVYGGQVPEKRELSDVRRWLKQGRRGMKLEDALPLCHALARNVTKTLAQTLDWPESNPQAEMEKRAKTLFQGLFTQPSRAEQAFTYLRDVCFKQVRYFPNQDEVRFTGVSFDRRYRILETGPYEHLAGKNINLNIGIDFSILGYGDSQTVGTIGLGALGLLGAIGVGVAGTAAVIGWPLAALAAGVAAAVGSFAYTGSINKVEGTLKIQSTASSTNTFLVVQKAEIALTIERHIKCFTTQFSPKLVQTFDEDYPKLGIDEQSLKRLGREAIDKALTRGLFVCDNQTTNEGEWIEENYYYVTQHFTAGDMLDQSNLLNHVWLLAIRGEKDFQTFMKMTKAREVDGKGEVIAESDVMDYSLKRLGSIYNRVIPTFPGLYAPPD